MRGSARPRSVSGGGEAGPEQARHRAWTEVRKPRQRHGLSRSRLHFTFAEERALSLPPAGQADAPRAAVAQLRTMPAGAGFRARRREQGTWCHDVGPSPCWWHPRLGVCERHWGRSGADTAHTSPTAALGFEPLSCGYRVHFPVLSSFPGFASWSLDRDALRGRLGVRQLQYPGLGGSLTAMVGPFQMCPVGDCLARGRPNHAFTAPFP